MNENIDYSPFFLKDVSLELMKCVYGLLRIIDVKDKHLTLCLIIKFREELLDLQNQITFKNDPEAIFRWFRRYTEAKKEKGL